MDVVIIVRERCPYCKQALECFQKLLCTDKYCGVNLICIEDNSEAAKNYDYTYLPAVFLGNERVMHGASCRADIVKILEFARFQE